MVLELSSSPRSVTVMVKLARFTVAVISSATLEAENFHISPPPMGSKARIAPPAQNVRLRRYQTGIFRLGALSRENFPGERGVSTPRSGLACGEPGCVSAGRGELSGLVVVGVIGRYLTLVEL